MVNNEFSLSGTDGTQNVKLNAVNTLMKFKMNTLVVFLFVPQYMCPVFGPKYTINLIT